MNFASSFSILIFEFIESHLGEMFDSLTLVIILFLLVNFLISKLFFSNKAHDEFP